MDPREKVLREYFSNFRIGEDASGRVEKINLHPNADHLFLDMDRVIQLGELNKKYKDYYIGIDEFVSRLLQGRFSVGSGMSLKLKDLNDRVEKISAEFEQASHMEEEVIEEDIEFLKELLFNHLTDYFASLKEKLKAMYHENNSELKESLIEARKTLKEELLQVINSSEFFDKNKFFVEFDQLKKQPLELEKFLKDYVNNEKTTDVTKNLDESIKRLSPVFSQSFSLDDKLSKYVLSVEKLNIKGLENGESESILDKFADSVVQGVDITLKRVRHFTKAEDLIVTETGIGRLILI